MSPAPFSPLHQAPHGPSSASSVGSSSFLSEWGMPQAPSLLHFSLLSPVHPATLEFLSHSPQAFNCHLIPVRNLPELPKIYSSSEFSHLPEAQWEMGSSHTFWEWLITPLSPGALTARAVGGGDGWHGCSRAKRRTPIS